MWWFPIRLRKKLGLKLNPSKPPIECPKNPPHLESSPKAATKQSSADHPKSPAMGTKSFSLFWAEIFEGNPLHIPNQKTNKTAWGLAEKRKNPYPDQKREHPGVYKKKKKKNKTRPSQTKESAAGCLSTPGSGWPEEEEGGEASRLDARSSVEAKSGISPAFGVPGPPVWAPCSVYLSPFFREPQT